MLDQILSKIRLEGDHALGHHQNVELSSAFQAIVSLPHQRAVGYEALIRGRALDGSVVAPPQLFESAKSLQDLVYLDRLCRALHLQNFKRADSRDNWLFLNIAPEVIVHGWRFGIFFAELLKLLEIRPERVVIEIMESPLLEERQLNRSVDFYRELGCLIAIDDFGAGHSNFQRIWRIKPHIVKLDQSIVRHAVNNPVARRMLPNIVATLHEAGSLVLIEGVETHEEAMIAMHANIDLVQGYYFGTPRMGVQDAEEVRPVVAELFGQYALDIAKRSGRSRYPHHIQAMLVAKQALQTGAEDLESLDCIRQLLALPGADRCYLLGSDGVQIGGSVLADHRYGTASGRFAPLAAGNRASWLRRPYLLRALQGSEDVHLTRPYLSVATGRLCVTLSVAYPFGGSPRILCYDLDHETLEAAPIDDAMVIESAAAL
ncbi:sensor domain-containing phosphodiesterase [Methylomonas sp. MED-D]|uniref:sensor domain-containing phosphodiesterase n=1 Tax=unclassified Methylomonas TaxID=2608980 RepID=UPI0028A56A48|nr:EAL domain-containing protein [Methylomonas sp. MV1]MDT4328394.1 EAL domain-containing protein [Methylomonas sp. MV1]